MRTEFDAEASICQKLQLETVRRIRFLQFLLLECLFFKDSEEGNALPLNLPIVFFPFSLMLHITKTRALLLLVLPCYFVRLGTEIVGIFAIHEHSESLTVASLGVAKKYRRLGIGTYMLSFIEAIAKQMDKKWMEVAVWKKNVPAQQFYTNFGFKSIRSERMLYIMKMEIR